jgi:hypothetical protein
MEEVIVKSTPWRQTQVDEPDWRRVDAVIEQPRVRMELGYNAEEELRLRNENPLHDMDTRTVKPATVIRFRF